MGAVPHGTTTSETSSHGTKIGERVQDTRVQGPVERLEDPTCSHPLKWVFADCLDQVRFGKGERHGGDVKPFLDQTWSSVANSNGIGFLTGQAQKKIIEAMESGNEDHNPDAFQRELLGAMAYIGMALIHYHRNR